MSGKLLKGIWILSFLLFLFHLFLVTKVIYIKSDEELWLFELIIFIFIVSISYLLFAILVLFTIFPKRFKGYNSKLITTIDIYLTMIGLLFGLYKYYPSSFFNLYPWWYYSLIIFLFTSLVLTFKKCFLGKSVL